MAPSWLSSNRASKTAPGVCHVHRRTRCILVTLEKPTDTAVYIYAYTRTYLDVSKHYIDLNTTRSSAVQASVTMMRASLLHISRSWSSEINRYQVDYASNRGCFVLTDVMLQSPPFFSAIHCSLGNPQRLSWFHTSGR